MNQGDIEALANSACFETNFQIKQEAERQFMNLCSRLRPSDYEGLMQNYSGTLIFVLMKYTQKAIENSTNINDLRAIFMVILPTFGSWHSRQGVFLRNGKPIERHVQNSIGQTLGRMMKSLYLNKDSKQWLVSTLQQQLSPRYRLYLWKVFIETVSEIDSRMGFLNYRNLVYGFQEDVIPTVTQQLIPYFMSVKSSVEINLLSAELHKSNLSERTTPNSQTLMLFTPEQQAFSGLVFDVLKQIMCFTYNLTYSQYDMENTFQNSTICFPQAITTRIVSREFIESVFYMIEKLVAQMPNSQYLIITLDCLQKILLCRMTYVSKDSFQEFLHVVLAGMNRVFSNPKLTPKVLVRLLEANFKMLSNMQMYKFRKYEPEFTRWLQTITNICASISSTMVLNFQNEVYKISHQLLVKIISLSISPKLQDYKEIFKKMARRCLQAFLKAFFTNDYEIMGETKIRKVKQLKKVSSLFFSPIKILIGIDYKENFALIEQLCQMVFTSGSTIKTSNLLLLIADLIESNYLEKNILYMNPGKEEVSKIGAIMSKTFDFINLYTKSGQKVQLVEISILIFIEKLISQSLRGLQWREDRIQLVAPVYVYLKEQMRIDNDENFLVGCFRIVVKGLESDVKERVQFALDVLSSQLMKLKWALKRENFKTTTIARDMLRFCIEASKYSLKGNMLKLRKRLFSVIALISFDDVMDAYKENINGVIEQLAEKVSTAPQQIVFDMTGICSTIDTSNIYKYFLTRFENQIGLKNFINSLYQKLGGDQKMLKAVLKMELSMVENRSQRLSNQKTTQKVYKMVEIFLPGWNQILAVSTSEQAENISHQLHKIFRAIVKGGHVNFFLVQKILPNEGSKYLRLVLASMVATTPWIEQYPKHFELLVQNGLLINRQMIPVILEQENKEILDIFSHLISFYLSLNVKYMKQLVEGNRKSESQLQKIFDINRTLFVELKGRLKFTHRTKEINNVYYLLQHNSNEKQKYLTELFQFALGNGRNHSTFLRVVASIIQEMSVLYNGSYDRVMQELGVDEKKVKSLAKVWNCQPNRDGDLFMSDLKEWFRMCDTDYVVEIDY